MVECKHSHRHQSGELVVSDDLKMMGGHGPDVKPRVRYYSLFADRNYKRVFMEDDDYTFIAPVDPDPIKLDESGEVVVLIKTVEGDLYLRVKGE
jgi:hypothetical protein